MLPRWAWILLGVSGAGILFGVSSSGPSSRTPVSMAQIRIALMNAWPGAIGGAAPPMAIRMLAAQIALETNNGAALMAYNLGNFKAGPGQAYVTFQTTELVNGQTVRMNQNFRSFPDLTTAAHVYLQVMHVRFGLAWSYAVAGDTAGFAQALKDEGYYTADEGQYAAGLVARGAPPLAVASSSPPVGPTFENTDDSPSEPSDSES